MKKALLIYYTFTGEAKRIIDIAATELTTAGIEVFTARVDFSDAALRLQRPMAPSTVKRWVKAAASGQHLPVVMEPANALMQPYDLICIFSNTWEHHPCVPIRSLLALPEMQAALQGKPFAVYIVCRRSWENNLDIVRREAEQGGGRFIGGERFEHIGSNIGSLIRTVSYLMSSGGKIAHLLGLRLPLPKYGLSDAALKRAVNFTQKIAASL